MADGRTKEVVLGKERPSLQEEIIVVSRFPLDLWYSTGVLPGILFPRFPAFH